MKVHWLALLLILGAALSAPSVSAMIIEEKNGYIVSTDDDPVRMPALSRIGSAYIRQGETRSYNTWVPSGKTSFSTDLNWGNPANSLTLTIYAPDTRFGPYSDSADGVVNGRIKLKLKKAGGLTSGTWVSDIFGQSVTGQQAYTYTTSSA